MMRYVIALFLINSYSGSFGAPTPKINDFWAKTKTLLDLSKNCGNLTNQIENAGCFFSNQTNISKKQLLECLMLYDINSQLCSAINNSSLVINEDITTKVKQEQDAENLCNTAKDWTFSKDVDLQTNFSTIFNNTELCKKFCGVEDLLSTDSIYICKYYYWGWEKLKNHSHPSNHTANVTTQRTENVASDDDSYDITGPLHNDTHTQDRASQNVLPNTQEAPSTVIDLKMNNTERTQLPNNSRETHEHANNQQHTVDTQSGSVYDDATDQEEDDIEGNGPNPGQTGNQNVEVEVLHPKGFIDEAPEDDHFFPLFLTAIILVVLLYVLYHNKGKVTKVVLGLIVEGRQNGRRRNSRGHAYRRLDTLEQAMSGNLAAQPSKIIY